MNVVAAKDVSVLVEINDIDIAVGCATAMTFEYENELIPKTDVNAGLFRKKRVRISDYRATLQGLVSLYNTSDRISCFYFLEEGIRRTEQYITFLYTDEGGVVRSIAANYLVQAEQLSGGADGDFAEFDLALEGTGNLTISEVESPPAADSYQTFSDWWQPGNGTTGFSGLGADGKSFAGDDIIEVVREMAPPLLFTSGTPGDRDYSFDGTTIGIWASNPFNGSERVFVIWQEAS